MNITPNACPYKAAAQAPKTEKPAVDPSQDGKFTIDDIICPFQRVAFNEGALKADAEGNVSNLPEVLRKFAGASLVMTGIANHAAKKLTADGNWAAFKADSYNLQDLQGSSLDHAADTRILRGGFNQDRLDAALSFSSDGERLTLSDLRAFQKANLAEEPGRHGEIFGAAEFALLVKVFGRVDGEGTKFIRNQDFVTIFRDNKWPEGWEPPKSGSLNLWSTGMAVREYFSDDNATRVDAGQNAEQAKKAPASCPFISGESFDVGEAAKHHSEMLP